MSINNIKDFYYILGLANNASKDDVKKAYRKLSLKFHPDKNDGDKYFEERFKDVNEAYETLVDDVKRKAYDDKLGINNKTAEPGNNTQTNSFSSEPPKKPGEPKKQQEGPGKTTGTPPRQPFSTPKKPGSNKILYTVIGIVIFLSPYLIKAVIKNISKDDEVKSQAILLKDITTQSPSSYDSTKSQVVQDASALPSSPQQNAAPPSADTVVAPTTPSTGNVQASGIKDEDGLTATDALKYFFQALNINDCNGAWEMTYNATWLNNGKDWFCSSSAFGGVKKVSVRNMYTLTQNFTESEIYVDYYAEDMYNGNECFKQNITLQKIAYSDKVRWKVTRMKNTEPPVACNETP